MSSNNYWYRLIQQAKENHDIFNGLTIPYIIGAYKLSFSEYIIDKYSVQRLLLDLLDSQNELTAVIEKCGLIKQYVIALRNHQSLEDNFQDETHFRNDMGVNNLFVIHEAKVLGNSIEEISVSLTDMYKNYLSKDEFSWDSEHGWMPFSERDKKTIAQAI